MPSSQDPFEVLGVSREAEFEEVRGAYRQAALRCHPDTNPDNPDEAQQEFYRVTEAYRRCLRVLRVRAAEARRRPKDRTTPQEQALREVEWLAATMGYSYTAVPDIGLGGRGWRKSSRPTLDETRLFVQLWPICLILALGAALAAGALGAGRGVPLNAAMFVGVYFVVYVSSMALLIVGLMLTRQVVILARQIAGYCARRALPGPEKERDLPRRPRWRMGRKPKG
jgi:hypothetical protein